MGSKLKEITVCKISYKCPKTNKRCFEIFDAHKCINSNAHVYSVNCYGGHASYIKIYKCKSCGKFHEAELQ